MILLLVAGAAGLMLPLPTPVQHGEAAADSVATAVRVAAPFPRIDGRLNDTAWKYAVPVMGFTQRDPVEGAPASMATKAWVVFSDNAIYVAVQASDPDPALIMAPLARRDERPPGDWVGIMLDSQYDRRTAFEFAVNPAGVRRDVYRFNDFEEDASWEGVWDAAVARDHDGWTAEFRIPVSQLRFVTRDVMRFGFNVYREIGRLHEVHYWRLVSRSQRGIVSGFGDLVGLDGLRPARGIEAVPFVVGRAGAGTSKPSTPASAGADLRLPLGTGRHMAASFNPDFGHVEADPAVVNLSSTEVFFPERRPLFVEGADHFRFPLSADSMDQDALFYSRRIGDSTAIIAAAKLLGRSAGAWSVGALGAATAGEAFLAGRVSTDFNHGRTLIGAFATALRRHRPPVAMFRHAVAGAVALTGSHRFGGSYLARALVAASHVSGPAEAIAMTQRAPVHYFQRPDIRYARFDPSRTSLTGYASWAEVARDRGDWIWSAKLATRSPAFEVNDAGFLGEAGRHLSRINAYRRWFDPGSLARRVDVGFEAFWNADFGGRAISRGLGFRGHALLMNYTALNAELWRNFGGADPGALRGGPALLTPANNFFRAGILTDPNQPVRVGIDGVLRPRDQSVSREIRLTGTLGLRPSNRLDVLITPAYEWYRNREQYVATGIVGVDDRYVLGFLRQRTFRTGVRAALTFTPALTVQAYAEPFVTNGHFAGFSEVVDPAARPSGQRVRPIPSGAVTRSEGQTRFDLDADGSPDVSIASPDFSVLSLRSTFVLRWEYRTASTVSLIVQHERSETLSVGQEDLSDVAGRLRSAPAGTQILLKASYWFSL